MSLKIFLSLKFSGNLIKIFLNDIYVLHTFMQFFEKLSQNSQQFLKILQKYPRFFKSRIRS